MKRFFTPLRGKFDQKSTILSSLVAFSVRHLIARPRPVFVPDPGTKSYAEMTRAQELEFQAGYWANRLRLVEKLLAETLDLERARRLEREKRRAEWASAFFGLAVAALRGRISVERFRESAATIQARLFAGADESGVHVQSRTSPGL